MVIIVLARAICTAVCCGLPNCPVLIFHIPGLGHLEFIDFSNVAVNIYKVDFISLTSLGSSAAPHFFGCLFVFPSTSNLLRCLRITSIIERF